MAGLVPFGSGFTFDNFFDDFFKPSALSRTNFGGFKLDVREEDKVYLIEADLPGIQKDEVALSLRDGTLEIAVTCEEDSENKTENYLHRERRFSSCKRSIYLGDADANNVSARLENGVLQVSVPKMEKFNTAHSITIQ